MLENAAQAGIDPIKFWEYTPFELNLIIKNYLNNKKEEQKNIVKLAYHIEAFSRTKKLPSLKKLLNDSNEGTKGKMDPKEMLEEIKRLNAEFGGEVY